LDITPATVTHYIRGRLNAGAKPATIRNEVATLGRGFTLAYKSGLIPSRPPFPNVRVNNARSGFFTDRDVAALLRHLPKPMRPYVEALYITAWRRSEMRSLTWSQVDWDTGTIRLERGTTKSGEPRSFPFGAHPRLRAILEAQRQATWALERERGISIPWVFHRGGKGDARVAL
jgi:integrase